MTGSQVKLRLMQVKQLGKLGFFWINLKNNIYFVDAEDFVQEKLIGDINVTRNIKKSTFGFVPKVIYLKWNKRFNLLE